MSTYSQENGIGGDMSQRSFWEIGQYTRTVKRMDNGHKLSNELIQLVQERSDIEKKYAKSLKHWAKRWNDTIEKGGEYGTTKSAWKAVLTEADRRAELHTDIDQQLGTEVIGGIKTWQKENYHKKMMSGFKETFEADEAFKKAQKPWSKFHGKVQTAKKAYHTAVKAEKTAMLQEKSANEDTGVSPDQVKKLQDKTEKCRTESAKSKVKYERALDEITTYNPRYMEDMKVQFDKTQVFERRRLDFFKDILLQVHRILNLSSNPNFSQVYSDLHNSLQNAEADKDLKWWKNNNGTGMSMNWPVFEEYTDEMHAISYKKSKGNIGGSGGENVAIHTYRSTSDNSNQEYDRGLGDSASPPSSSSPRPDFKWPHYQGWDEDQDTQGSQGNDVSACDEEISKSRKPTPAPRGNGNVPPKARAKLKPGSNSKNGSQAYPGYYQHSDYDFGGNNEEVTHTPFDDDDDDEVEMSKEGVQVRALYDYDGVEEDELTFKQGDVFIKLEDEDEQGWCKGRVGATEGLYPANYVEEI